MAKQKILNDPIYGLISFPFDSIYDLMDHPWFQRLRRISQVGLTNFVYPGATHSRFHHTLGVVHLCDRLIRILKSKGVIIRPEEHEACCLAALFHDMGHGPFSHSLEFELIPRHHEEISLEIMRRINDEMDNRLELALAIFKGEYNRTFYNQILSGQLDVDRMDYLNRDSYYTGVAEGIIGYERILAMMNVFEGRLVIEEKGIFSIEKFLLSRYLMYRQVYLHHASLSAEYTLKMFIRRYAEVKDALDDPLKHPALDKLLDLRTAPIDDQIGSFIQVDDIDVTMLLKKAMDADDTILQVCAQSLLNRKLFRTLWSYEVFDESVKNDVIATISRCMNIPSDHAAKLIVAYDFMVDYYKEENEIEILKKDKNKTEPLSLVSKLNNFNQKENLHFLTFPKGMTS